MLLGFKRRFEPMIVAKAKRHTIRAKRKIPPRVGEICHCYTGLRQRGPIIGKMPSGDHIRQKMTRLLGRWPCVKVQEITIGRGIADASRPHVWPVVYIDEVRLSIDECQALAISDAWTVPGMHAVKALCAAARAKRRRG